MERQPGFILSEPERRLCADQMDLMVPARQRLGQLRRHDTASANRGVTHHSDMHGLRLFKQMFAHDRLVHHHTLSKPDASQRAELGITAFDELAEARSI